MIELDHLPLYELHAMYYVFWRDKIAEQEMTDEQRGSAALSKMIEDNI